MQSARAAWNTGRTLTLGPASCSLSRKLVCRLTSVTRLAWPPPLPTGHCWPGHLLCSLVTAGTLGFLWQQGSHFFFLFILTETFPSMRRENESFLRRLKSEAKTEPFSSRVSDGSVHSNVAASPLTDPCGHYTNLTMNFSVLKVIMMAVQRGNVARQHSLRWSHLPLSSCVPVTAPSCALQSGPDRDTGQSPHSHVVRASQSADSPPAGFTACDLSPPHAGRRPRALIVRTGHTPHNTTCRTHEIRPLVDCCVQPSVTSRPPPLMASFLCRTLLPRRRLSPLTNEPALNGGTASHQLITSTRCLAWLTTCNRFWD